MRGLAAGRSFVTTGPLLLAKADGQWSGSALAVTDPNKGYALDCTVLSEQSLESIELIVNGVISKRFDPQNEKSKSGSFASRVSTQFIPKTSSWVAWRCFEKRAGDRFRFAHTAPWQFEMEGKPLRPRRPEIEWLVANVKAEIARSESIAPPTLIDDYRKALAIYEGLARTAR
jgi:hypothetical protein